MYVLFPTLSDTALRATRRYTPLDPQTPEHSNCDLASLLQDQVPSRREEADHFKDQVAPVTVRSTVVPVELIHLVSEGRKSYFLHANQVDHMVARLETVGDHGLTRNSLHPSLAIGLMRELLSQ